MKRPSPDSRNGPIRRRIRPSPNNCRPASAKSLTTIRRDTSQPLQSDMGSASPMHPSNLNLWEQSESSEYHRYRLQFSVAQSRLWENAERHMQVMFVALETCGCFVLASRLAACPSNRRFWPRSFNGIQSVHITGGCELHKLCLWCSTRRTRRIRRRYLERINSLNSTREFLILTMTLTIRSCLDLEKSFRHLDSALRQITKRCRESRSGRRTKKEFSRIAGMIVGIDFAANETGWSPHAHALILVRRTDAAHPFRPFDHDALKAEWRDITGDSDIVEIKQLRYGPSTGRSIKQAVASVLSYSARLGHSTSSKPDALTPEQRIEVHLTTKGQRLLRPSGAFLQRTGKAVVVPKSTIG